MNHCEPLGNYSNESRLQSITKFFIALYENNVYTINTVDKKIIIFKFYFQFDYLHYIFSMNY